MTTQDDIQGHWQRAWLRAPGFEDETTRVHWMQAGGFYADVRIPLDRPELGDAPCLAALPCAALDQLARAEGFAGTTEVADSICTWRREINWHGATDEIDAGKLWFEGDLLIEDGVHADYREQWRLAGSAPGVAQKLSGDGSIAYLVTVGDAFVFGAGAPDAASGAAYEALFDRVHAFGHWVGEVAVPKLCTNPFLEGGALLRRQAEGILWKRQNFTGDTDWVTLT